MNCTAEGCDRVAQYKAAQLCQKHYFRVRRGGTTGLRRKRAKGRFLGKDGYIRVYRPDHPLAAVNGLVQEHRVIAYDARNGLIDECERCRMVLITWKTCHVDHDDENRSNNSPSNLLVTCNGCNTMRPGRAVGGTLLTVGGETKNALQWSRDPRVKVCSATIRRRKASGASDEESVLGDRVTHHGTETKKRAVKFEHGRRVRV